MNNHEGHEYDFKIFILHCMKNSKNISKHLCTHTHTDYFRTQRHTNTLHSFLPAYVFPQLRVPHPQGMFTEFIHLCTYAKPFYTERSMFATQWPVPVHK